MTTEARGRLRPLSARVRIDFEAARPYWTARLLAVLKLRAIGLTPMQHHRAMERYPSQWQLALRYELRQLVEDLRR